MGRRSTVYSNQVIIKRQIATPGPRINSAPTYADMKMSRSSIAVLFAVLFAVQLAVRRLATVLWRRIHHKCSDHIVRSSLARACPCLCKIILHRTSPLAGVAVSCDSGWPTSSESSRAWQ